MPLATTNAVTPVHGGAAGAATGWHPDRDRDRAQRGRAARGDREVPSSEGGAGGAEARRQATDPAGRPFLARQPSSAWRLVQGEGG